MGKSGTFIIAAALVFLIAGSTFAGSDFAKKCDDERIPLPAGTPLSGGAPEAFWVNAEEVGGFYSTRAYRCRDHLIGGGKLVFPMTPWNFRMIVIEPQVKE
jgi:hypothetical protein